MPVFYKLTPNTYIEKVSMKELLPHHKTKHPLTGLFAEVVVPFSEQHSKSYTVSSDISPETAVEYSWMEIH